MGCRGDTESGPTAARVQWIVLALWKVGDYRINRGQNSSPYYVSDTHASR